MSDIRSFSILDQEIKKNRGKAKPIVLEALWDGDTHGWRLILAMYTQDKNGYTTWQYLGRARGNDKLSDAEITKEIGQKAIEKYGLEFYFPSEEADDNCPSWREKANGIHCADCNKLMLPRTNEYLPKDVCFHCNMERERVEEYKSDEESEHGITMYLYKKGKYEARQSCGYFDSFTISSYLNHKVPAAPLKKGITDVTIDKDELLILKKQLEDDLEPLLKDYTPAPEGYYGKFQDKKLNYKGVDYVLNPNYHEHQDMVDIVDDLYNVNRAINEGAVIKFLFKSGFTYRDNSILGFIRYNKKGKASIEEVNEHYKKYLPDEMALNTLKKLEGMGCLTISENIVKLTKLGKEMY